MYTVAPDIHPAHSSLLANRAWQPRPTIRRYSQIRREWPTCLRKATNDASLLISGDPAGASSSSPHRRVLMGAHTYSHHNGVRWSRLSAPQSLSLHEYYA